jgi:N-acyl-L-homoserine lactone synthetase
MNRRSFLQTIELARRDRVVDMGRTCRKPGIRDAGQKIIWGLVAQSWIEARALGFTEICGCFSPVMIRFYRRFGFRIEILGHPASIGENHVFLCS